VGQEPALLLLGSTWGGFVAGVGLKHFTGDVKKMLTKILSIDQNNYPEMLGHTCIINAPVVFKAIWSFIRPMLDARTAGKIEVPPCATYSPSIPHLLDICSCLMHIFPTY
jgi:CRAL/TRIO domain